MVGLPFDTNPTILPTTSEVNSPQSTSRSPIKVVKRVLSTIMVTRVGFFEYRIV